MKSSFPLEKAAGKTASDPPTINVVILYDDAPAGHRAMRTVAALNGNLFHQPAALRPQLWRFDLLQDAEWFALALADAINADMLILSTSHACGLSTDVERWLKLGLARKRGTSAAVVALLGPDDHLDEPGCPRFRFVEGVARNAGLDFFAPGLRSQEAAHPGGFKGRLLPVLAEAFNRIEPAPRWGINE
jgi:hypothetical protein